MIGTLEADVLASLRHLKEAPARDVREELAGRGVRVAYTTVATILSRLWEKGLVRRRRETCRGGERYVYHAVNFERRYLRGVLQGVVQLFGPAGVSHLDEELQKLPSVEESQLRRRLRM